MIYKSEYVYNLSSNKSIRKYGLLKKTSESAIYIGRAGNDKYIIREAFTNSAVDRMESVIRLFDYILELDSSFPCLRPCKVENFTHCKSVYIEKYVDGICLNNVTQEKYSLDRIGLSIINYLIRLHTISINNKILLKNNNRTWNDNIFKFIHDSKENLNKSSLSNVIDVLLFVDNLEKEASEFDNVSNLSIVHNDMNADNILVLNDSTVLIIDYERWIVGDPLKDLSKMIWYLHDNIEFRRIFLNQYEEHIGKINYKRLTFYFKLDILNHISKYDKLINIPMWVHYYNQEFKIISSINKGRFKLW